MARNLENAGQLYTLAANQGHGPATLALARLVAAGAGTEPDSVKAWALASLAAERKAEGADELVKEITAKLTDKEKTEAKKQLEDIKSGKTAEAKPAADPKPAVAPKKK